MGLYRDDGLACYEKMPGSSLERRKKKIIKLFKENGLQITTATNLKSVEFSYVNFNLCTEKHEPYKMPNNEILHVDKKSNNPNTVLKEVPHSVNMRLQHILSSSIELLNLMKQKQSMKKHLKRVDIPSNLNITKITKKKIEIKKKNEKKKQVA